MPMLLSDYTAVLNEIVLPYVQDNFPKDKILVDQMKRNAGVSFINDEFIAPVRTARHGGVASLGNDGNNLNVTGAGASFGRGTVSVKRHTGAFRISKLAMDASQGKGAIKTALSAQIETLTDDFGRHINRMLYSDGVGAVSQVLGSVSGTQFSVMRPDANLDDGRSIDWYGSINGDIDPVKYLTTNQLIGIGTGAAAVGTIAAMTGTSVQLTGATASVANDTVYVLDGSGAGAGTAEIQGIRAALSSSTGTSTYAGLARSTTGWTASFGSALEALSLGRMEQSYLTAREYGRAGDSWVILVNKTLFRKYGDILTAMRRTVDKADLLGGFKGLEFAAGDGNVGVFLDYDVPDGEVLILNLDTWRLCQVQDLDWVAGAGGEPLLRVSQSLVYEAAVVWFANAFCLAPAANGRETRKTG